MNPYPHDETTNLPGTTAPVPLGKARGGHRTHGATVAPIGKPPVPRGGLVVVLEAERMAQLRGKGHGLVGQCDEQVLVHPDMDAHRGADRRGVGPLDAGPHDVVPLDVHCDGVPLDAVPPEELPPEELPRDELPRDEALRVVALRGETPPGEPPPGVVPHDVVPPGADLSGPSHRGAVRHEAVHHGASPVRSGAVAGSSVGSEVCPVNCVRAVVGHGVDMWTGVSWIAETDVAGTNGGDVCTVRRADGGVSPAVEENVGGDQPNRCGRWQARRRGADTVFPAMEGTDSVTAEAAAHRLSWWRLMSTQAMVARGSSHGQPASFQGGKLTTEGR